MTNYGKIDILWYDVSWPLSSPKLWESRKMTGMARKLQPHILVNNRAQLPEDFGGPHIHVVLQDRDLRLHIDAPRGAHLEPARTEPMDDVV